MEWLNITGKGTTVEIINLSKDIYIVFAKVNSNLTRVSISTWDDRLAKLKKQDTDLSRFAWEEI